MANKEAGMIINKIRGALKLCISNIKIKNAKKAPKIKDQTNPQTESRIKTDSSYTNCADNLSAKESILILW